jgi:hypothetical protein
MIGPDSVVVRDNEPITTMVDAEVVMLSVRAGAYFGLGETGSEIWTMIEHPQAVAKICGALQQRFEVNEAVCRRDVIAFLTALHRHGLICLVGQAKP